MAKYTVSLAVDARVDVTVEAKSLEEAKAKAPSAYFEWKDVDIVDLTPVNATGEDGVLHDY